MSSYNEINQLLDQIGTSTRSTSDPWTISRSSRGEVKGSAFNPAVTADLGSPIQDVTSAIQSSEKITQSDATSSSSAGSSTGGSSSSGSGILGGLLEFFPLASGIAKLFGFGSSAPAPGPTPYELPPSINFQGAMTGPTSGVTSLSYGANGLPRTSATASNFVTSPAQTVSSISGSFPQGSAAVTAGSNPAASLSTLTNNAFAPGSSSDSSSLSASLASTISPSHPAGSSSVSGQGSSAETGSSGAGGSSSRTQTGSGQNVMVQVQAMDSQSFMDRSGDIAQAVRQAMLNSSSVNDVMLDL